MRSMSTRGRRLATLLTAVLIAAGLVVAGSSPSGAGTPTPTARVGATPQILCQKHGTVVFMQYAAWSKPPASNGCWTIIKPRVSPDNTSYRDCDMSANPPTVTGGGNNWIYDDTNVNGHGTNHTSDQSLDNTYCGGRTSWWGEYMASSGGFVERWSPTYLFEENYTSSHAWVGFTESVNYTGSNPTVGPIPTVDVLTSSLTSHITTECYDAADYPSDYWFSVYNGPTSLYTSVPSATVDAIDAAFNSCYHS